VTEWSVAQMNPILAAQTATHMAAYDDSRGDEWPEDSHRREPTAAKVDE
jgi:hypothetical protein